MPADDPFARLDVAGAAGDVVAWGGTLNAPTLLSAYRAGCFPWPSSTDEDGAMARLARRLVRAGASVRLPGEDPAVPWCSPDPRAVLLTEQVRVSRSLRQRLRHSGWYSSVDTAFGDVVAACADREDGTWISSRMQQGYAELHRAGAAHSLEVWDGAQLVGGLYGVQVGAVFCGESMFHQQRDASKVALVELCARLREIGVRLVDVQQPTEHLASLGAVQVRRADYLSVLAQLRDEAVQLPRQRLPVARLAPTAG